MSKLNIANPHDRTFTRQSFVLCFGAYGNLHVLVYADHLEDALDEAVDWLEENAPGMLLDRDDEPTNDDDAIDLTCAGNHGRWLPSWEWGIAAENPTKAELIARYRR